MSADPRCKLHQRWCILQKHITLFSHANDEIVKAECWFLVRMP